MDKTVAAAAFFGSGGRGKFQFGRIDSRVAVMPPFLLIPGKAAVLHDLLEQAGVFGSRIGHVAVIAVRAGGKVVKPRGQLDRFARLGDKRDIHRVPACMAGIAVCRVCDIVAVRINRPQPVLRFGRAERVPDTQAVTQFQQALLRVGEFAHCAVAQPRIGKIIKAMSQQTVDK